MTRSVVVLGAGRSGTSMVTGMLADAGLHPGEALIPASAGNPRGYFEAAAVNRANDDLMAAHLHRSLVAVPRRLGWLAALPASARPRARAAQLEHMRGLIPPVPYCLKDPRFSFTLDAWRPLLAEGTGFVCVFRDPSRVAESVRVDALRDPAYYAGYTPSAEAVWSSWDCAYRAILGRLAMRGRWLFVDADALMDDADTGPLADLVGTEVPSARIDRSLRRSVPTGRPPPQIRSLYGELRRRARQKGPHRPTCPK